MNMHVNMCVCVCVKVFVMLTQLWMSDRDKAVLGAALFRSCVTCFRQFLFYKKRFKRLKTVRNDNSFSWSNYVIFIFTVLLTLNM